MINSRLISINHDQFKSVFDVLRKNSVGIVNLTFLHQSNTHVVGGLKLMKINLTIQIIL
jgi:hypothetical protein